MKGGTAGSGSATAIGLIVLAALLFAVMDATTKYLSAFLSMVVVLWSRYAMQVIIMAVWVGKSRGRAGFRTGHLRFQVLRGILLLSCGGFAFFGLRSMPLAEFTAIVMLSPVLVTAISGWLTGEPVGKARWAMVWGGFLGTLLVIRPGSGLFGAVAIMPLMAMFMAAAYSLITSRLAVLEASDTTQFYTGLTGTLVLLPVLIAQGDESLSSALRMAPGQLLLLVAIGMISTIGHLFVVMSFARATAAVLMPFTYTQIGFAAVMSWLLFRHAPDAWAWTGMAIIAACGAGTAWLNMRGNRQRQARIALHDATGHDRHYPARNRRTVSLGADLSDSTIGRTRMRVQVIHRKTDGSETRFGTMELDHMPPVGEPFPLDDSTCYEARGYFGPDDDGNYLLILGGEPQPMQSAQRPGHA